MNKPQIINAAKIIGFWKENDVNGHLVLNGQDEVMEFAKFVWDLALEEAAYSVDDTDECGEYGTLLSMCSENIRAMKEGS